MACALIQKNQCQQLRGKSGKGQVFKSCFFSKSEWASKHWYWSLVRFFSMNLAKFTHIRCTWCTVCGSTRIRTRTQVQYNSRQHSAKGDAFMNILSPRPIWWHFLHFCYKEQWHCHDHSSQNAKPFSKQIRIKARLAQVVLRWSCWSIWREGPSPGMLFFFQNAFGQLRYWQMLKGKGKMICRRFWPSEPSFVEALALPFRYADHHVAHRASEATWWKSEFRKAKFRIWITWIRIHWNTLNPFDIMWSERTSFWDVRQVVNAYIFKRSLGLHLFSAILYSDSCFFLRFNSDVPYKFEQQTVGRILRLCCLLFLTQLAPFHIIPQRLDTSTGWNLDDRTWAYCNLDLLPSTCT